jgi:hypothetical protein
VNGSGPEECFDQHHGALAMALIQVAQVSFDKLQQASDAEISRQVEAFDLARGAGLGSRV